MQDKKRDSKPKVSKRQKQQNSDKSDSHEQSQGGDIIQNENQISSITKKGRGKKNDDAKSVVSKNKRSAAKQDQKPFDGPPGKQTTLKQNENGDLLLQNSEGIIEQAWFDYAYRKRDYKAAQKYYRDLVQQAPFLASPTSSQACELD